MGDVAIVHEWLSARAGSEKTFLAMADCLPSADLYALSKSGPEWDAWLGRPVETTLLDVPARRPRGRALVLPLMPASLWWLGRKTHYSTLITSSHAFARYFGGHHDRHLCYVYSPMRYAWLPGIDRRASGAWMPPARALLRALDRRSVARVTSFAAISSVVRDRIERFYDRPAAVIHPPVDTDYFARAPAACEEVSAAQLPEEFLLSVGRLVPYKRHDLAIEVSAAAKLPLVVAGTGPSEGDLRRHASDRGADVRFLGAVTDETLRWLYARARATIFLPIEDFGIVPVESLAAGTPVLAVDAGGARDTVGPGGILSPSTELNELTSLLRTLLDDPPDDRTCREHASIFSHAAFNRSFVRWVGDAR